MNSQFIITLAAILLMPLIPAFLLYKFLPSKTNVGGPFKGLSLKLTGAFAGYFLLVISAMSVFYFLMKNQQAKTIEELEAKLAAAEQAGKATENWKMYGVVASTSPKETNMFFDKTGAQFEPTGEFELPFSASKEGSKTNLPKSVCIYNYKDGYRVINLSREFAGNADIKNLEIQFNDTAKTIHVGKVINIQTKEEARVNAENALLERIKTKQVDVNIYKPQKPVFVNPESLQTKVKVNRIPFRVQQ